VNPIDQTITEFTKGDSILRNRLYSVGVCTVKRMLELSVDELYVLLGCSQSYMKRIKNLLESDGLLTEYWLASYQLLDDHPANNGS